MVPGAKLVHITGNPYYESFCRRLHEKRITEEDGVRVLPYTNCMHEYMFASDLVICRSGAITAAELTACGKPAILIPSPNVTANHQYFNAKAIADKGGAVLIEEKDLTPEKLKSAVMHLMNNKEALNAMAKASCLGSYGRSRRHLRGAGNIIGTFQRQKAYYDVIESDYVPFCGGVVCLESYHITGGIL